MAWPASLGLWSDLDPWTGVAHVLIPQVSLGEALGAGRSGRGPLDSPLGSRAQTQGRALSCSLCLSLRWGEGTPVSLARALGHRRSSGRPGRKPAAWLRKDEPQRPALGAGDHRLSFLPSSRHLWHLFWKVFLGRRNITPPPAPDSARGFWAKAGAEPSCSPGRGDSTCMRLLPAQELRASCRGPGWPCAPEGQVNRALLASLARYVLSLSPSRLVGTTQAQVPAPEPLASGSGPRLVGEEEPGSKDKVPLSPVRTKDPGSGLPR